jgi:hypothetical protein
MSSFQSPDKFIRLALPVPFSQHLHASQKSFAASLSGNGLANLSSEYCSQRSVPLQRPHLIQRKRL